MNINNLLNNENVLISESLNNVQVVEYKREIGTNPSGAISNYFAYQMGVRKKQVLITLDNDSFITSAGAMQWTCGNVQMISDVKGVGDFLSKTVKGAVTNESAIKPKYSGTGYLMLEPTYKFILLEDLDNWGGNIVVEDGMFKASSGTVQHKIAARSNISSAVFGREGLFNLSLQGKGVVVLESPVPRQELVEITLNNEELRIDGSYAIAWSGSLQFTVEKSSKSLIASGASGEGLVNVFRGTGKVLMAPIL